MGQDEILRPIVNRPLDECGTSISAVPPAPLCPLPSLPHPTLVKVARALALLLAAGILFGLFRREINWKPILIPAHMVRLSSRPPDSIVLMPVVGASPRASVSTWHAPRPGGRRHEGQDIFAAEGTPVVSATDGVVTRIAEGGLGGKHVWIFGPGGRSYYYAHLSGFSGTVSVGDFVEAATVIGYVGNTGNARTTPPHLHFGVYSASGAIDPAPLLSPKSPSNTNRSA